MGGHDGVVGIGVPDRGDGGLFPGQPPTTGDVAKDPHPKTKRQLLDEELSAEVTRTLTGMQVCPLRTSFPQFVAERRGGVLGRELPVRAPRSRDLC